jgi:DNA-binding response OmpR family regulator
VTAGERTIDVHVKRLRENIGDLSGTYIESVHRRGYRVPNIIEEKKVATTEEQRP